MMSATKKMAAVASIAAGVTWSLKLSLLTPYVQVLGIPHKLASLIWLCGPIYGLLVQSMVGYYRDCCRRRRPFIAVRAVFVAITSLAIGYAADIGHILGDRTDSKLKIRSVIVFTVGFYILDVANNMVQGPCRALLADISGPNPTRTRNANSLYSFFMAVGNIMGFAVGSITRFHSSHFSTIK